jgi:hypothetical protein
MSAQPTATNKICTDCREELPVAKFFASSLYVDGLTRRCKRCVFDGARREQQRRAAARSGRVRLPKQGGG